MRTLSLNQFESSSDTFFALIRSHAQTLKSLKLFEACLLDGNWADIFDEVEEAMDLDVLELGENFGYVEPGHAWYWESYFDKAIVRKGHGIEIWPFGPCRKIVPKVQLFCKHKLGRILFGRDDDPDDGILQCVDFHLRRIGWLPGFRQADYQDVRRGPLCIHQRDDE